MCRSLSHHTAPHNMLQHETAWQHHPALPCVTLRHPASTRSITQYHAATRSTTQHPRSTCLLFTHLSLLLDEESSLFDECGGGSDVDERCQGSGSCSGIVFSPLPSSHLYLLLLSYLYSSPSLTPIHSPLGPPKLLCIPRSCLSWWYNSRVLLPSRHWLRYIHSSPFLSPSSSVHLFIDCYIFYSLYILYLQEYWIGLYTWKEEVGVHLPLSALVEPPPLSALPLSGLLHSPQISFILFFCSLSPPLLFSSLLFSSLPFVYFVFICFLLFQSR